MGKTWLEHKVQDEGRDVKWISEHLNCGKKIATQRINAAKKGLRKYQQPTDGDNLKKFLVDHSTEEAARHYSVDPDVIRGLMIVHGIQFKKRGYYSKKDYDINLAVKMLKEGSTLAQIREVVGINEDKLSVDLRKLGHKTDNFYHGPSISLTDEEIIELYASGMSSREIESKHNISFSSVIRRLKENNVDIKTAYDYISLDLNEEELEAMYTQENLSISAISGMLDVSKDTISKRLKRRGVTLNGNKISWPEKQLLDFVRDKIYGDAKSQFKLESGIRPDILTDTLAIEYNGCYWHSDKFIKDPDHVTVRINQLKEAGYEPIIIWSFHDLDKAKDLIMQRSGICDRVYARKCKIKEVSASEAKSFLDKNHMQGFVGAKSYKGLYQEDELVQMMTFSMRGGKYELSRLCTKRGKSVVGGASRLWKAFISEYNPEQVISYCDPSLFTGQVYDKLGFVYKGQTAKPSYLYSSRKTHLSRQQCQKHKLVKLGFDPSKSERQIMLERGFHKVNLCRQDIYEYNKYND